MTARYEIPEYARSYLKDIGYSLCNDEMLQYIEQWYDWLKSDNGFYHIDSTNTSTGRHYLYDRMSIHPARRVCREWASLMLNDKTTINCDDEQSNEWLASYLSKVNFFSKGQGLVEKSFALGTGAWAIWLDTDRVRMQLRRYDARMLIPLSWDDDGISECAFCTKVSIKGKIADQLQIHQIVDGTYHIVTKIWVDSEPVEIDGVIDDFDTTCETPTFGVVTPAIENTRVDLSPYGESVFADAIDAIKGTDLAYDSIFNEVKLGKMRIFIGDMLLEVKRDNGKQIVLPMGEDEVVFRKVSSMNDDLITTFAPQLRTDSQIQAYTTALQTLGDLTGFGSRYFSPDKSGGIRTATEVSSDNSDLMRNIRKHENLLQGAIIDITKAVLHCARELFGVSLPDDNIITVNFDDSIITDTSAEKAQDQSELGTTLNPWEYRVKWYGESEEEAKANVPYATTEAIDIGE